MTLRGSLLSGIGALVTINLATAFGGIGLLMRMSPAVQDILAENVYSIEAAEDVMAALVLSSIGEEDGSRERIDDAILRARANVTEEGEIPAIDNLQRFGESALGGDQQAIKAALEAAEGLIEVNRDAMQHAGTKALNLGMTGAWAAVTLALCGFVVSVLVIRRIVRGVAEPLEELESVTSAYRRGDRFRRCQAGSASQEIRRVLDAVNELLDRAHVAEDDRQDSSLT